LRVSGAVLCATLLGGADQAYADTFHVPSAAHPTVQSALDAAHAAPGADTVSLAAGTYRENVRVNPQRVTLTAPAGPGETTLDATGRGESAMRIIGGEVTVRGLRITGGTGTEYGGPRGGGVQVLTPAGSAPARATFANCVISGNTALDPNGAPDQTGLGGGVFANSDSSVTFNRCVIEDNRAGDGGGGIFGSIGSTIRVNGGVIRNNEAGVFAEAGGGGGIEVGNADVFVRGAAITGNTSTAVGGAVHSINHRSSTERRLVMSDCYVSGNATASQARDDHGGAIQVEDRVSLVMNNCAVTDNHADAGGAIASFRAHVSVTDSVIANNEATKSEDVGGGAVMSIGAQTVGEGRCPVLRLTRVAVVGNVAASRGGGVHSSEGAGCGGEPNGVANLEITDSTISQNTTHHPRGGGVSAINTRLRISDSHVNGNAVEGAGGRGGGILVSQGISTATITRSTIAANVTPESAAGIFITGGGSPTLRLTDSWVYANQVLEPGPSRGGGLVVNLEGGSGIAANGVVSGNVIADNTSWQIAEQEFEKTEIVYANNEFGDPVPGLENLVYRSTGTAPNPAYETGVEFNAATLGTPDRTDSNVARTPDFVRFLAAPTRFVPGAPGSAYLSWSVARPDGVTLAGSPTEWPATDATAVPGGACDQARTFELRVERDGQAASRRLAVAGAPCEPDVPPVPLCPAGTSPTVTCSMNDKGRLLFAGTRAAEAMRGTAGADIMVGGGGADRLFGRGGGDTLMGQAGKDRLTGGAGRDRFDAGSGKDRVDSKGQRRERVRCGGGKDRVRGARGDRVKPDCERVRR
jgi:RTX calcium-binding nonapeptide repeat (4 copies)